MRAIEEYRHQMRELAARAGGTSTRELKLFGGNMTSVRSGAVLDRIEMAPRRSFQNLDPTSPDFGKVYFISGIHAAGDPNHPIGPDD